LSAAPSRKREGERIGRIEPERLLQQSCGLPVVLPLERPHQGKRAHDEIVGVEAFRPFAQSPFDFGRSDGRLNRSHDAGGDLVLEIEQLLGNAIVVLGPEMVPIGRIDQLGRDAKAVACPPYAPFEEVPDAEFAADLLNADGSPLRRERRVPGDDEERPHPRQSRGDVLDDAIGEMLLLGVASDITERQNGDRRPVRQ
jgi:hypothetical protein